MSSTLVTSSVTSSAFPTTFTINTKDPKAITAANAINIGDLQEENTSISISDQGQAGSNAVSSTFTTQDGDVVSLAQSFNNPVDEASTNFQLYDSEGDIIADSNGTDAQQQAYDEWVAGTLSVPADTYTAIATPYDGVALSLSTTQQQGSSLGVTSTLTGGDPTEYYNFSLSTGNNLKLNLDADSTLHVQLLDSNGDVIADNQGNSFEQANYQALTSSTGLAATTGDYTVAVSYPPGDQPTQSIAYDFQLYSGSNYAVVYQNNVTAQPYDPSALGSVTATSDAQLYSRQGFNSIQGGAAAAVNIGWLQENKSSLDVYSQLTAADGADYYSFTLQQGNNLKFGFTTPADTSDLRVQILSGDRVIADNEGTAAQQAAYLALTTTNGLTANAGNYTVEVSYAKNAPKTDLTYEFGIFSGTSYAATYKTLASPQTYANALASGSFAGSAPGSAIASYLTAQANGLPDTSLTDALKLEI